MDAADTFRLQADGRSEDEFAPLGFEQVDRADGRVEAFLDEAEAFRSWSNFGGRAGMAAWTAAQANVQTLEAR